MPVEEGDELDHALAQMIERREARASQQATDEDADQISIRFSQEQRFGV